MYCILGLCFLRNGACVQEAGVGISGKGREEEESSRRKTPFQEVLQGIPGMGPGQRHGHGCPGSCTSRGKKGERAQLCLLQEISAMELPPVVSIAAWALTSSWGLPHRAHSGELWGAQEGSGELRSTRVGKASLAPLQSDRGICGWTGPYFHWDVLAATGKLSILCQSSHPKPTREAAREGRTLLPLCASPDTPASPSTPCLSRCLPHGRQPRDLGDLSAVHCLQRLGRLRCHPGRPTSLDAIIVPRCGAAPGDTARAGLCARPVGGSGSGPEC